MKAFGFVFLAALVPALGCGVAEGEQEQEQVDSQQQALLVRLTTPPGNLGILRDGCYDGSSPPRLRWDCLDSAKTLDGSHFNTLCKREVGANDTEIGTNLSGSCYWGHQCVDFVKGATQHHAPTSSWNKGANVVASGSANPGDAVATFDSAGNYNSGHTGIFMSYLRDAAGNIVGFRMADQNWSGGHVTKHEFRRGYSGNADADKYFIIRVAQ